MQHIGNKFDKTLILNLAPGLELSKYSFYQVNIRYFSRDDSSKYPRFDSYSVSYYVNGHSLDDLNILVGSDVYEIDYSIQESNKAKLTVHQTHLRIDRLILLNLAVKLIRRPITL